MNYPSEENNYRADHVDLVISSYRVLLGKELLDAYQHDGSPLAKALFYAPFVVVSHTTDSDPIFNYANLSALDLFGFNWEEFTQLPSRLSAEPKHQFDRERLLTVVNRKGYLDNYQGVRITKYGNRFLIKNAVVWNFIDSMGNYAGQAACFAEWQFL